MKPQTLIEQALAHYHALNQLSLAIEQALLSHTFENLKALCRQLNHLQEEAKAVDSRVLLQLREQKELRRCAETKELLVLMQCIHTRNQRLLPQVNSIMAVQRNESHTLKKGASVLRGYHSGSVRTGRRISSAG